MMGMKTVLRFALHVGVLAVWLMLTVVPARAEPPSEYDILRDLGLTLGDRSAIREGEVRTVDLPRLRDDELAVAVVAFLPARLSTMAEAVVELDDPGRRTNGTLVSVNVPIDSTDWQGVALTPPEAEEAARLLQSAPDSAFNLSVDEIARLSAAAGYGETAQGRERGRESVSEAWRAILMDRLRAYANEGLSGVAPYAGGSGVRSPATALRDAFDQIKPVLAGYFPAFVKAVEGFPEAVPGIDHRFFWKKEMVDGRSAFSLRHDVVDCGPASCLIGRRVFFVSHTYDGMQDIVLLLPVREGTMMFRFMRTYTQRVAGPFNGFERRVGQTMMSKSLIEDVEDLRARRVQPVAAAR
ncbi:MAG: hypothetical protein IPM60_03820 [Rhodospirillales bacterium]|nr:hypothetical protein [Rhodospirillales bacterium]